MAEDAARAATLKRLQAKRRVKSLAATAAFVITVCVIVWAVSGAGSFWPGWVMLGFGIALFASGWHAYGPRQRPITEEEIQREMRS
jgi:fatty acid desaturase